MHPDAWKNDKQIFSTLAEHCIPHFLESSFSSALDLVRGDKKIMSIAVVRDYRSFFQASADLQEDVHLIVVACSASQDFIVDYCDRHGNDRGNMMRNQVRATLDLYENFIKIILCAMTFSGAHNTCALHLLNQGETTTLAYKKLIAECLGIPNGRQIHLAVHNIESYEADSSAESSNS